MKISASVLGMLMTFSAAVQAADRTYAGLQDREIKALSSQQIGDLREGRGMGMALAAELNNYPGPRHVLDLAGAHSGHKSWRRKPVSTGSLPRNGSMTTVSGTKPV